MMSPEEHKLVLSLFAFQATMIKALANALESKGVLELDDLPAFGSVAGSEEQLDCKMLKAMGKVYQEFGEKLGLHFILSFDR